MQIKKGRLAAGSAVLALTLLGPTTAAPAEIAPPAPLKAGQLLYERGCAICHGAQGKGDGLSAPYLNPKPRDFTTGMFKFRTTASGKLPTDEDLARTIIQGLNGTAMSPWRELSKKDIAGLVAYVKTLVQIPQGEQPEPIKVPPQTRFTMEGVKRGERWYAELECVKCHGQEGRGDGPSAAELKDDWNSPILPADLSQSLRYKRGAKPVDIYYTLMTGLMGTPMPSYAGVLEKPEDEWDLVYYVYWLSQGKSFPTAQRQLQSTMESVQAQ
jgi:cytochrome c oxidase cbb3-type subunit 2